MIMVTSFQSLLGSVSSLRKGMLSVTVSLSPVRIRIVSRVIVHYLIRIIINNRLNRLLLVHRHVDLRTDLLLLCNLGLFGNSGHSLLCSVLLLLRAAE